ncbi:MAG: hypothetical protein KAZ71_06045 [Bacteroidia bacterium]|nr:hypothetical protein [Bacteroidia bacterium]
MQQQIQRKTRKEKITEYQQSLKTMKYKINWVKGILPIIFIGTLILTVFEIEIYRQTLINWAILTFIWFLPGIILTPFTRKFLKYHIETNSLFLQFLFNTVTWGGLLIYGFMATNYYYPTKSIRTITAKIIRTGHLAKGRYGCGPPYCDVVINNKEKELIFPCGLEIEKYKSIDLKIQKGLWGFEIVAESTPVI